MKNRLIYGLVAISIFLVLVPSINFTLAADTVTPAPSATPKISTASTSGSGWFFCNGHRDSFSFSVMKGTTRADGWNYAPTGYANYQAKLPIGTTTGQVNSMCIYRYRIDSIDGGIREIIVGIAQTRMGQDVRNNWWFRITVRDMDNGQNSYMIQLWRPIGADHLGGWSFGSFDPSHPATLKLNDSPFYQAQGIIKGGTINIQP
jgi:hypothetical protein